MTDFLFTLITFISGVVFALLGLMFSRSRDHYKEGSAKRGTPSYVFSRFWGYIDRLMFTPISTNEGPVDVRDFDKSIVKVGPRVTHIITFLRIIPTWGAALAVIGNYTMPIFVGVLLKNFGIWEAIATLVSSAVAIILGLFFQLLFRNASMQHNFQLDHEKFIWDAELVVFDEGYMSTGEIEEFFSMRKVSRIKLPILRKVRLPVQTIFVKCRDEKLIAIFWLPSFLNNRFGQPVEKLCAELQSTLRELVNNAST